MTQEVKTVMVECPVCEATVQVPLVWDSLFGQWTFAGSAHPDWPACHDFSLSDDDRVEVDYCWDPAFEEEAYHYFAN